MPLSDTTVRMAKPRARACKLTDGNGLYVEVAPVNRGVVDEVPQRFN